MPIEHASVVIPAIEEGYKHKDEILSVWKKITSYPLGKKSSIGITGMPGIGKSVLLELRSKPARTALQKRGVDSIQKYRENMLLQEIADLRRRCGPRGFPYR